MSGGTNIRAIGPGSGADAPGEVAGNVGEPLTLDENWVESEHIEGPVEEAWEDTPSPQSSGRLVPLMAIAAVAGWTGFFAWAHSSVLGPGISPQAGTELVVQWAVPVLLVIALVLLALRLSTREAGRFSDAAIVLRNESAALESRLSVVNRELSLAREFLAAQSRELETLGRVATQRISEHADRLQALVQTNGAQVDAIAGVSRTALDNMEKLRDEFASKVQRKATAIEDIRQIVEEKLAQMLAQNPLRMNYEKKYEEIIATYNQDKDRATIEDTFNRMMDVLASLDVEQQRAVAEGLTEDQLALFDLVQRGDLNKTERERIKQASHDLLAGVLAVIAPLDSWTEKEQTQAEVESFILDQVYLSLPEPPYTADDKAEVAQLVYRHIWQQSARDSLGR